MELPRPKGLPSPSVNLNPKGLEEFGQKPHFLDHDETPLLLVQIEIGFLEDLPIGAPLHIEVDSISRFGDFLGEGGLPNMSGPRRTTPACRSKASSTNSRSLRSIMPCICAMRRRICRVIRMVCARS